MAQESAEREKQNNRKFLNYSIASLDLSPVVFWDGFSSKRMLIIKNESDIIFSSNKVEGASYEVKVGIKIVYRDNFGKQIGEDTLQDLQGEIPPNGGTLFQEISFPFAQDSGLIEVYLVCYDK